MAEPTTGFYEVIGATKGETHAHRKRLTELFPYYQKKMAEEVAKAYEARPDYRWVEVRYVPEERRPNP